MLCKQWDPWILFFFPKNMTVSVFTGLMQLVLQCQILYAPCTTRVQRAELEFPSRPSPKSQIPNTTLRRSLPTSRLPVMFFFLLNCIVVTKACGKSNGQRVMRNGIWDWDLGFETGIPAQISQQKMWQSYEKWHLCLKNCVYLNYLLIPDIFACKGPK